MTLENVMNKVEKYINESRTMTLNYIEQSNELSQKVNEGMRGQNEVHEQLGRIREDNFNVLLDKSQALQSELESAKEQELNKIEENTEPITADTLAELELLSQLELDNETMSEYINKYKQSPLALKKLQEISRDKKLMCQFPPNKKEYLNIVAGRISSKVSSFSRPNYDEYGVKVDMLADGAISSLKEDVSYFNSL